MAEEDIMIEDEAIALDDTNEPDVDDINVSDLAGYVMGKYKKAEDYRYEDEQRWVRACLLYTSPSPRD